MHRTALLLLVCSAAPAMSQGTASAPQSNTGYARQAWREVRTYLLQAATEAPDSLFAFRPTSDVRSFGETLDHIAASEHGYARSHTCRDASSAARIAGFVVAPVPAPPPSGRSPRALRQ